MSIELRRKITNTLEAMASQLEPAVSNYLWALTTKGIRVEIHNGKDVCDFAHIAHSSCPGCESCILANHQTIGLKIRNLETFLDLINQVNQIISIHRSDFPWLKKLSIISIWNNATEYDFEHPEEFLKRLINILEHMMLSDLSGTYIAGDIEIKGHMRNISMEVVGAPTEQEAPFEMIVHLSNQGEKETELNELQRVRFGISGNELIVTSVQMAVLGDTVHKVHSDLNNIYCETYNVLTMIRNVSKFSGVIEESVLDNFYTEADKIASTEDRHAREALMIQFINDLDGFISKFSDQLNPGKQIKGNRVSQERYQLINGLIAEINTFYSTVYPSFQSVVEKIERYNARSLNQSMLNNPMRLYGAGGAAKEVGSCVSLMCTILSLRQIGIDTLRFPLLFPLREQQHVTERTKYIEDHKRNLVERVRIELGLSDNDIVLDDDGCAYTIDITNIKINRDLFIQIANIIEAPTEA